MEPVWPPAAGQTWPGGRDRRGASRAGAPQRFELFESFEYASQRPGVAGSGWIEKTQFAVTQSNANFRQEPHGNRPVLQPAILESGSDTNHGCGTARTDW